MRKNYANKGGYMNSVAIIGLGHAFSKQYDALKKTENFNNIELCDNDINKINAYKCNSNYLTLTSDNVIVATSPKLHLEMIKSYPIRKKE